MNDELALTIPITLEMHHIATQRYQQQPHTAQAKQLYLNTLAVMAVQTYLTWMGVKTDLTASDSWDLATYLLADTAALMVHYQGQQGQLECRPVLPEAEVCYIPPEVWEDRLGYVVVQLDRELTEATLLGFLPQVSMAEVPLHQVRSLAELWDRLHRINLRRWLQQQVDTQWHNLSDLLKTPALAWQFRDGQSQSVRPMERGKLLHFYRPSEETALEIPEEPLALLVSLTPSTETELDVCVGLCPTGTQTHLPPQLEIMVLDDQGIAVMQMQARESKILRLRFGVELGERFSVRVVLGSLSLTETFAA